MSTYKKIAAALAAISLPASGLAAPLSVDGAVAAALSHNASLAVTKNGEAEAEADLARAKAAAGWNISLSDSLSISKQEGSDYRSGNSLSLNGSYSLYDGGQSKRSIKSGEIGMDIAALQSARAEENIKKDVVTAYYDLMEARENIEVCNMTHTNMLRHLQDIQDLYKTGVKARVDVLRAEVEVSNAAQDTVHAYSAEAVKLARLKNLMGTDGSEPLELDSAVDMAGNSGPADVYTAYARDHRKDLAADRQRIHQRELALQNAISGREPSVKLSMGAGHSFDFSSSADKRDSVSASAGVNLNWNVFDSGLSDAEKSAAKASLEEARLVLERDSRDADLAVQESSINMSEAASRYFLTEKSVEKAKEDVFISKEKYKSGEGIFLDVIDAELALKTAQQNRSRAKYDFARSRAALENAAGFSVDNSLEDINL